MKKLIKKCLLFFTKPSNNFGKTPVKILNTSGNPDPVYAKPGDSGMDIRYYSETGQAVEIPPRGMCTISTGIFVELPEGYEFQVRPKSGLAANEGITAVLGTVDEAYRGEIKIILSNARLMPFKVIPNARMAQIVLAQVEKVRWIPVSALADSERGKGGFGHTGID